MLNLNAVESVFHSKRPDNSNERGVISKLGVSIVKVSVATDESVDIIGN